MTIRPHRRGVSIAEEREREFEVKLSYPARRPQVHMLSPNALVLSETAAGLTNGTPQRAEQASMVGLLRGRAVGECVIIAMWGE